MISLLHATRGRPNQALLVRAQWFATADDPGRIEHIFAIDDDDEDALVATDGLKRVVVREPRGCFKGYNAAAKKAKGDILFPIEDDVVAPQHWDTITVDAFMPHMDVPAVLLVDDGNVNRDLVWVINRAYWKARGLYHEGYFGNFGDTEMRERIKQDNVLRIPSALKLDHRHHSRGLAPYDEIYQRKQARYGDDQRLYDQRKANGWR